MNKQEIYTLITFNFWANMRILAASENISMNQFSIKLTPDSGWSSLCGILVHTLDAEYGWRCLLQGLEEEGIHIPADFESVALLKIRWKKEQTAWLDYSAGLTNEQINLGYGDDPESSPKVWEIILHVVTHGIQHRSESAVFLTGFGHSPGELDFDRFLREKSE